MEEMFRQGDQEKQFGIEISPMCDRETACIYSTQVFEVKDAEYKSKCEFHHWDTSTLI
ncbi:unnamed protein product [Schistosoma mattheei]|uniref:Uncharacterized protein n=1 Tax=Schistosoma mattheei TaxID=31246 RepID=A0A183Q5V3_9TREM|nr:unnamed protein product [Schistosoma mattheei]